MKERASAPRSAPVRSCPGCLCHPRRWEAPVEAAYDGRQIVGMDLHRHSVMTAQTDTERPPVGAAPASARRARRPSPALPRPGLTGNRGCPWAPLWPGLIITVERPRWHRDGDDPEWLPRVVAGAELECGAQGDGQAYPRCQFHSCRLIAILLPPHASRSTDDVPDLLDGPVGDSSGDLARFELEVRETAKVGDPAQRPDRGPIGCCYFRGAFQRPCAG